MRTLLWDDDGVYGIGDRIRVTVTFSEDINVTGSPRLELDIGGSARTGRVRKHRGWQGHIRLHGSVEGDADNDGIAAGAEQTDPERRPSSRTLRTTRLTCRTTALAVSERPPSGRRTADHFQGLLSKLTPRSGFDDILTFLARPCSLSVEFNEDVLVAGSPRLALDFQGTNQVG